MRLYYIVLFFGVIFYHTPASGYSILNTSGTIPDPVPHDGNGCRLQVGPTFTIPSDGELVVTYSHPHPQYPERVVKYGYVEPLAEEPSVPTATSTDSAIAIGKGTYAFWEGRARVNCSKVQPGSWTLSIDFTPVSNQSSNTENEPSNDSLEGANPVTDKIVGSIGFNYVDNNDRIHWDSDDYFSFTLNETRDVYIQKDHDADLNDDEGKSTLYSFLHGLNVYAEGRVSYPKMDFSGDSQWQDNTPLALLPGTYFISAQFNNCSSCGWLRRNLWIFRKHGGYNIDIKSTKLHNSEIGTEQEPNNSRYEEILNNVNANRQGSLGAYGTNMSQDQTDCFSYKNGYNGNKTFAVNLDETLATANIKLSIYSSITGQIATTTLTHQVGSFWGPPETQPQGDYYLCLQYDPENQYRPDNPLAYGVYSITVANPVPVAPSSTILSTLPAILNAAEQNRKRQ